MAFIPVITSEQCGDCTKVTLKDETDYTDEPIGGFTSRSIKLLSGYGDYYIPPGYSTAVIDWPLDEEELELEVDQDYAFALEYTIVPTSPESGSIYTRTFYLALACNLIKASDAMIQLREIDQEDLNLNSYRTALADIQIERLCATRNAQSGDVAGSQRALDRGIGIYNDYQQNPSN